MKTQVFRLTLLGLSAMNPTDVAFAEEPVTASFAVVELFTSEGCSSCPPADRLLAELAEDAKKNGRRIFPLAFHVDYWNHLGWTDPFSLPACSKRQEQYTRALGQDRLYTPQMIVNGTEQFVGSDRVRARKAVDSALARLARVSVTLQVSPNATGCAIEYRVSNAPENTLVCVALVESELVTEVQRGENAGRSLRHRNVVREFTTGTFDKRGTGRVSLNTKLSSQKKTRQVIAFVQDRSTMEIVAAMDEGL